MTPWPSRAIKPSNVARLSSTSFNAAGLMKLLFSRPDSLLHFGGIHRVEYRGGSGSRSRGGRDFGAGDCADKCAAIDNAEPIRARSEGSRVLRSMAPYPCATREQCRGDNDNLRNKFAQRLRRRDFAPVQRFAQCGDRDYASAGSNNIAIHLAGSGVKQMHIVKRRRFGQSRDLPASFVFLRITTRGEHHRHRCSLVPFDRPRDPAFRRSSPRAVSSKSDFKRGRMTCVSGSPNRQLNSRTRGPSAVTMRPGKSNPRKITPLFVQAIQQGTHDLAIKLRLRRSRSKLSAGLNAPMPPVFGPASPS